MRVFLQLREHFVAVELGHEHVEEEQVEPLLSQQVERLAAVLGEDDRVPLVLETAREQEPVHAVVVCDENRAGCGSGTAQADASERSELSASSSGWYSCSIRPTSSPAP